MRRSSVRLVALVLAPLLALPIAAVGPAAGAQKKVPSIAAEAELSFAPLVRKAAPAVVNIYAKKRVRQSPSLLLNDPFFKRFFGENFGFGQPAPREQSSLGSGVIVRVDGIIVTALHVISGADEITVVLTDKREFDAEILRTDDRTDLAVLKIQTNGETLPFLELRDADELEVGDLVLAIGNPFGVGQTVTSGIVSALARTSVGKTDFRSFIQTDAAINPGNSGGALVSMDGRLVGINTAIYSKTGASHGVGFAIPSNMVTAVIAGATRGTPLVRPWLGAGGQNVTAELAESLGLVRPTGILINKVYPGGPADSAGLRLGDVVYALDGREVQDEEAFRFRIATRVVGDDVELRVMRKGAQLTLPVTLIAPPENPLRDERLLRGRHPLAGATVANLSPALADELYLFDVPDHGVIIVSIRRNSAAYVMRFVPGDILLAINGKEVSTVERLVRMLTEQVNKWHLTVQRGSQKVNMVARR